MKLRAFKTHFVSASAALLTLLCGAADAATHYIREGGTASTSGTGACSGWATANACDDLPQTLVRGDSYCVADGSYSGRLFNTPNSGSAVITVRKAVQGDGTCSLGPSWSTTYGDGQAHFTGNLNFGTDYWVIDGARRNENNWADGPSYGIRTSGVETNYFVWGHASDNITLKYVDIGPDYGSTNQSGYSGALIYIGGFAESSDNWLIHRSYIHNGRAAGQHAGVHNIVYEYNYIGPNWEKTAFRHQVRGSSVVFRYNIFKNACQGNSFDSSATSCTAIIGWYGNAGSNNEDYSNSKVYGNLFWDTQGTIFYSDAAIFMGDNRASQGGGAQNCAGCEIYNNTFVGLGKNNSSSQLSFKFEGIKTGTQARNNIWYDFGGASTGCTAATCSNNYAISHGGVFANAAGGDFRLTSDGAAGAGAPLSSPFNLDMAGISRGSGMWDVGAFEYSSGGATALAPPLNLQVR